MTRTLDFASPGGSVVLDGSNGIQAKIRTRGTGLPPVAVQWFEGAGDGASFRGGRNLPRVMDLDLKVYGADRDAVRDRMSLLGRIFALPNQVRMTATLDGIAWYADIVRTGGGDWDWASDTDGRTFIKTIITVQAGSPYWTSKDGESRIIALGGLGVALFGTGVSLTTLSISESSASGEVQFTNSGDVPAFGVWTVRAPFSGFDLVSPSGDVLSWGTDGDGVRGATKASGFVMVDMAQGTAVDETGANVYGGFGPAPRFWAIPPGGSDASVIVEDAVAGSTRVEVSWNPMRWVMF